MIESILVQNGCERWTETAEWSNKDPINSFVHMQIYNMLKLNMKSHIIVRT